MSINYYMCKGLGQYGKEYVCPICKQELHMARYCGGADIICLKHGEIEAIYDKLNKEWEEKKLRKKKKVK